MSTDPAAARLAEMKILTGRLLPLNRKPSLLAEQVAEYVPSLIDAVERVLKQADEWTEGSYTSSSALDEDRAWVRAACGAKLREAITSALTGAVGDEEREVQHGMG